MRWENKSQKLKGSCQKLPITSTWRQMWHGRKFRGILEGYLFNSSARYIYMYVVYIYRFKLLDHRAKERERVHLKLCPNHLSRWSQTSHKLPFLPNLYSCMCVGVCVCVCVRSSVVSTWIPIIALISWRTLNYQWLNMFLLWNEVSKMLRLMRLLRLLLLLRILWPLLKNTTRGSKKATNTKKVELKFLYIYLI